MLGAEVIICRKVAVALLVLLRVRVGGTDAMI